MITPLKRIARRFWLQIMSRERAAEAKPLSFSTTMRNPLRIADFLNCIAPFEGKILTHDIIMQIMKSAIKRKIYAPMYITRTPHLKAIHKDEEQTFTDEQIDLIIENSPQDHKEAGFAKGWDSRFDTYFKLPKEYGYLFYEMDKPILISTTGHMMIDATNETPVNDAKIENVFLNSMIKYQSNNPFRKNANSNIPLLLLLKVIDLLKNDADENDAGVFRQELSLFICWPDNDADALYRYIKEVRRKVGFDYSDEYMYSLCLDLLGTDLSKAKRFKMKQICGEAVDEYIRKMRTTGLLSLRGNGRFLDFNTLNIDKIRYVLDNYGDVKTFDSQQAYYSYCGEIDSNVISIEISASVDLDDIRQKTLRKFATEYSKEKIEKELENLATKSNCTDAVLKFISQPARLEFLTSIYLMQNFSDLQVLPNYIVDDEGLPTHTALGNVADIVCHDKASDSLVEVTLMCGRSDQINNEMLPITRHLSETKADSDKENVFAVFIAPIVHSDVQQYVEWVKFKDKLDILPYTITGFVDKVKTMNHQFEFVS